MDVTLLRTLALKSVLGFGKYRDMTVHQVLSLKRTGYLRWCYYNLSNISFNAEILDLLYIDPEVCIKKPGVDPEMYERVISKIEKHTGALRKYINKGVIRKGIKIMNIQSYRVDRIEFSKANMQARNHGR